MHEHLGHGLPAPLSRYQLRNISAEAVILMELLAGPRRTEQKIGSPPPQAAGYLKSFRGVTALRAALARASLA